MRRWVTALFLVLTVFYLGAAGKDRCGAEGPKDRAAVCHILCNDGCATAPLPESPAPPPPDPLPRKSHAIEPPVSLVSLVIEPEKDPPKA